MADTEVNLTLAFEPSKDKTKVSARFGEELIHLDRVDLNSARQRAAYARELVNRRPGLDAEVIERELMKAGACPPALPDAVAASPGPAELLRETPRDIIDEAERNLRDERLIERILDDVAAMGVAGERTTVGLLYLVGVSRLLRRPLALIVCGLSSSGKSYLIEATAALFPPEAILEASQMTPQALFHLEPGTLVHRFVVAGERSRLENDERAEATRALREMISSGRLTKLMPAKVGGEIQTLHIEQDGPIAYVESTTLAEIFEEDRNWCLVVHTDERPEQTRRIVSRAAALYSGRRDDRGQSRVVAVHHAMQRMLERVPVIVPFASRIAERFPTDRVEARRAFPQFLTAVAASALLHQFQRERDADGSVVAAPADYHLVRFLLAGPLAAAMGKEVSAPARRFHERLRTGFPDNFTVSEVRRKDPSSKAAIHGWLQELHRAGLADLVEESRGRSPARWRLVDGEARGAAGTFLPTVEEVFGAEGLSPGRTALAWVDRAACVELCTNPVVDTNSPGIPGRKPLCPRFHPESMETEKCSTWNRSSTPTEIRAVRVTAPNPGTGGNDTFGPDDLPEEWRALWEEWAAIREYDAGLPREYAEALAWEEIRAMMRGGATREE